HVFRRDTHAMGHSSMLHQHTILAVHRHYIARAEQRQHQLDLLPAAMPRYVHLRTPLIVHICTLAEQIIDVTRNRLFVADYRRRAEYHHVTVYHLNKPMIAIGDLGKRRGWLTLATSADDNKLAWRYTGDIRGRNQYAGRHAQIPQLDRH